LLIISL